jgi:hypothetical protein
MSETEQKERFKDVLLWCMYHMESRRLNGELQASEVLSEKGLDDAKSLIDSGFQPTPAEIILAAEVMRNEFGWEGPQ